MIKSIAVMRNTDAWGSGYFHAPRGNRKHNGIDFAIAKDSYVLSPVAGIVTKVGYPYADDLSYRYIQITSNEYKWRLFYIEPSINKGDSINIGDVLGTVQDLDTRYPDITSHIHVEIKDSNNSFINPEELL